MNDNDWRHEEKLVHWLLEYYGLYDARARFMILDEQNMFAPNPREQRLEDHPPPPKRLTIRAFDVFFQHQFPVRLEFQSLTQQQAQTISAFKLVTSLDKTRFHREFVSALQGAAPHRGTGVIFHWPHQRDVGQTVVIHDVLPVETRVPGPHFVWTEIDGSTCIIETLAAMLASLDAKHPPKDWQSAAKRGGYDMPLR